MASQVDDINRQTMAMVSEIRVATDLTSYKSASVVDIDINKGQAELDARVKDIQERMSKMVDEVKRITDLSEFTEV